MLGGAALNWAFWAITGRRVVPIGLDAMLGLFCEPADWGPRLTGWELEAGRMVAEAWPVGHCQAPVCGAADCRGGRGEHPARAAGAIPRPDRGVGDWASAASRSGSVVC